ncbi:RDD family protein [Streptomyces sp. enrichment culture]|uniref:RDD family protein n=1 Tax=Streptomyces sp. enrichment culture TaxID=1795815 RepID=UPI003F564853
MSELVTGEAVALELRPAKLPSRALAVLLDLIAVGAAYTAVSITLAVATASLDDAAQMAVSIASFLLVLVGGPIAVETLSHGRSLGKMACGLRVVRDDGGPIRFRHALVRGAVGVVEILGTFGVVACIASLVSARGRRLGDVFAGTLVVRERVPVARSGYVPPPPPWLAGRFSGLDLSAVPDGLWLAVRQYLTRMQQLDPQVGAGMAGRLAADLAARTGTPVPQGVPPAAYLAAVLQERQVREAQRAFGTAATSGAWVPGGYGSGNGQGGPAGAYGAPVPTAGSYGPQAPPAGSYTPPVPPADSYGSSVPPAGPYMPPVPPAGPYGSGPGPAAAPVSAAAQPVRESPERGGASGDRPAGGFVPPA